MGIFKKENIKFAKSWIKNPARMGTFLPLSSKVGKKLALNVSEYYEGGSVLEIGSGSGALTKFLQNDCKINSNIICVEIDSDLCSILRDKFPKLQIFNKNAVNFDEYISQDTLKNTKIIVSSIPFLTIDKLIAKDIIFSCSKLLKKSGGIMFHVSYTSVLPFNFADYGMEKIFCKMIWGIPMAYIHCYKLSDSNN